MIPTLRVLERRRCLLVARSAALRGEIRAELQPVAARIAAVDSVLAGLRRVLYWGVRIIPIISLLRRH